MAMLLVALLLFPKLALGLSGFETGVAVMPLVQGDAGDTPEMPAGRIRNTRKLLRTAALIMSVLLIGSSFVTTLLIPPEAFGEGGEASGRALAYLAHHYLGDVFGTIYDISTIAILWFAGASAMAGLLNLVPRYLPRYGMAPEWTRATRPLVTLFTGITFLITIIFNADVEAQGGAYATGVLVLMTSAALAVTLGLEARHQRSWMAFAVITRDLRLHDDHQRHRAARRREDRDVVHRHDHRHLAHLARAAVDRAARAGRDGRSDGRGVSARGRERADSHHREPAGHRTARGVRAQAARRAGVPSPAAGRARAVRRSQPSDASLFSEVLAVEGADVGGHRVLRCASPAIPNAIAALLLFIRDRTRTIPHAYFGWTEGNPIAYLLKFLAFGEGDTAPVTREVLRQAEPDPELRPRIHVG